MYAEKLFYRLIFIPAFFVLTVLLAFLDLAATAQVKSKNSLSYPKVIKSPAERQKLLLDASPILKLVKRITEDGPLSFAWQLNTDTLVKVKDVFREVIEFEGGATIRKAVAIDTVTLHKLPEADYDVRHNFFRFSMTLASFDISQQKGKPILVLTSEKSTDKLYFKVFLDKAGKGILKLQNLSDGRFYLPVPFEGGTISM